MIAVTGASGQLGRLVLESLLKQTDAANVVAVVRSPEAVADFAARGVIVRQGDYDKPETLAAAFEGVDKVLLISSNAVGQRLPQHKAVIDAAKAAKVQLLAYTSLLRAPQSKMILAAEHIETEAYLRDSGLPAVILRNGWYSENYVAALPMVLEHGAVIGTAGAGRFSTAARADYAEAAAKVLTAEEGQAGKVYELAGDAAFTLSDLAALIGDQSGKAVVYSDMTEADYAQALVSAGLPEGFAKALADSETRAKAGELFDEGGDLSKILGRATTPMAETVKAALAA